MKRLPSVLFALPLVVYGIVTSVIFRSRATKALPEHAKNNHHVSVMPASRKQLGNNNLTSGTANRVAGAIKPMFLAAVSSDEARRAVEAAEKERAELEKADRDLPWFAGYRHEFYQGKLEINKDELNEKMEKLQEAEKAEADKAAADKAAADKAAAERHSIDRLFEHPERPPVEKSRDTNKESIERAGTKT